ncbi:S-protein homolog 21-like [Telopea speciosissima]|uniref:S-protein homolog 21-like n=1 Tax=Telopea speciosissima TaxID=54955 RepID=UPI001CC39439|nr:S-protein homolog 21-like [Telopea speciosissima]
MNTSKFFLVLACTLVLSKPYFVQGRGYTVYVINDLGPIEKLNVHCKSKDDDLGPHTLGFGEEFYWVFDLNVFGTTLFWCNMDWGNKQGSFEIFNARKEQYKCGNTFDGHYYRKVRKDGVYYNKHRDGDYWKKYSW